MKRRTLLLVALIATLVAGCMTGPKAPPPGTQADVPTSALPGSQPSQPVVEQPGGVNNTPEPLESMRINQVSLERFSSELLRQASQKANVAEYLTTLFDRWGHRASESAVLSAQADLNGDGSQELITAFTGTDRGSVLVIYRQGDGFKMDQTEQPGPYLQSVSLYAVTDVTGDGRPEIIWAAADAPTSFIYVSTWRPGRFEQMNGEIRADKLQAVKVESGAILLKVGVAGAIGRGRPGDVRMHTDRYRLSNGAFKLVEQRLDPSPYGIHKLQDGMLAEHFGDTMTAAQAYGEAMDPDRVATPSVSAPDGTTQSENALLPDAVRAVARFRLGVILLQEGRTAELQQLLRNASGPFASLPGVPAEARDAQVACQSAATWAESHADFQEARKSPLGYVWDELAPESLCKTLSFSPAH